MSIRIKLLLIVLGFFIISGIALGFYTTSTTRAYRQLRLDEISKNIDFETERMGRVIQEMEYIALNIAMISRQAYNLRLVRNVIEEIILPENLQRSRAFQTAVGVGLWMEPYMSLLNTQRSSIYYIYDPVIGSVRLAPEFDTEEYDYHTHMWYREIVSGINEQNLTAWSSPYYEDIAGVPLLLATVGAGVFDSEGRLVGITSVSWEIQSIADKLSDINIKKTENSFVLLSSPVKNFVIFNTRENDFSGDMQHVLPWHVKLRISLDDDDNNNDNDGVTIGGYTEAGVEYITFSKSLDNGWVFSYHVPANEIFSEIDLRNARFIYLISFLTFLLFLIKFYLISRIIIKPLKKLTLGVAELGGGNLDKRIEIRSKDEIGTLAGTFNKMAEDLKTSIEQIMQERAEKEREKEAGELKSRFLANMSHEIRTPMNAIIGISELMLSENLSVSQYRYVQDINISAMGLLNIINDILDLSKIQANKLTLVPEHYDFSMLIDNVSSMVLFLVRKKNIKFELITEGKIPGCLYGDDVRLRQILLNLLGNAVKFTNKGHVRLIVKVSDENIYFDISDTGIGIQEDDIPELFDAFKQTDMKKNRKKEGTGLGLSIVQSLVEMMGGTITVESVYGKGSVFHVVIPKVLGDETLMHKEGDIESTVSAPDAKILVVDDNKINLNVACGLLRLCDITAETAESGSRAIELIRENQYDLVFMDHMMPEMDGVEATRIIRETGVSIPIVALTANAIVGAKEEFLAAGMNDMLTKPIDKVLLNVILEKWLPSDKVKKMLINEKAAEDETEPEFREKLERITGLSVQTGLGRVSGQRDVYIKSLKLTIKEINKCDKNLKTFLAAGDMRNFCIEVHSMKGSLANIGAMELSSRALELEVAANKEDKNFCSANMPQFLEDLNRLGIEINEALAEKEKDNMEIILSPESLSLFDKLTDALNKTDFIAIEETMKSLDTLNPDGALHEEIEKIKDAVLIMDYIAALEVVNTISRVRDNADFEKTGKGK